MHKFTQQPLRAKSRLPLVLLLAFFFLSITVVSAEFTFETETDKTDTTNNVSINSNYLEIDTEGFIQKLRDYWRSEAKVLRAMPTQAEFGFEPLDIKQNFLLEWLDPLHRSPKLLQEYLDHYTSNGYSELDSDSKSESDKPIAPLANFFAWLHETHSSFLPDNKTDIARIRLQRSAIPFALNIANRKVEGREGRLFLTHDNQPSSSIRDKLKKSCTFAYQMFIIDLKGDMYVHCYSAGVAEHANLAGWKPVAMAGLIKTWNGYVQSVVAYAPQYGIPSNNLIENFKLKHRLTKYFETKNIRPLTIQVGRSLGFPWELGFRQQQNDMLTRSSPSTHLVDRVNRENYLKLLVTL